jgi:hypothetical protein
MRIAERLAGVRQAVGGGDRILAQGVWSGLELQWSVLISLFGLPTG